MGIVQHGSAGAAVCQDNEYIPGKLLCPRQREIEHKTEQHLEKTHHYQNCKQKNNQIIFKVFLFFH